MKRVSYAANADRYRQYAREYKRGYYAANADRIRKYQRKYNAAYRVAHPEYDTAYRIAIPTTAAPIGPPTKLLIRMFFALLTTVAVH
ncbi:hypothetical protein HC776_03550 [bacterium]|nr:hypothetical protein [bacterium]